MPDIQVSPANFAKPIKIDLPEGVSLNEISLAVYGDAGVPNLLRDAELVIEVDGEYIPKAEWDQIPAAGSLVNVYMPLRGQGKSPLRIILTIAVVVAGIATGGWAAAAYAGTAAIGTAATIAGALASAAVMTAGSFLVNALAPIRPQGQQADNPKDSPVYSISGARNQLAPYAPVPVVLGRHKFFPPMAAKPYTELDGSNEYVRILLAWVGPCRIENIRIGDTPIADYPGFSADGGSSIEIREGWATDEPTTLMPSIVNQTRVDVMLTNAGGWVNRTMGMGYDELSVEVSFPRGLVTYNKEGERIARTVNVKLRYREAGAPDWIYFDDAIQYALTIRAISTLTYGLWGVYATFGGAIEFHQQISNRVGAYRIGSFMLEGSTVSGINHVSIPGKVGMVISTGGGNVQVSAGSMIHADDKLNVKGMTTAVVRRAFYGKVDRTKSYEVGLFRETVDSTNQREVDEVWWTVFRGTKNDPPLNFPVPMAQIAIRIKASEGAQNQIDIINCIASSYAPRFVSGAWEASPTDISSNPAAIYRGILQHPANKTPKDIEYIDDDTLGEWYDLCETEGYSFNQVREFTSSVWECLADVAFAGRAAPAMPYGKWSVDFDQATRSVRGHVTPRNSWGFRSEKTLMNRPHAFKIIFNNEFKEYLEDEIIVYDDGYSAANANIIERLEFKGITEPDLAWRFGRYHIAQARLRPEIYSVFMDFEHLTFRRGNLLMVSHDVPRWGDHWGRVKSVQTSGANTTGVTLDEEIAMYEGEVYAIRFRLKSGASLVMSVVNVEEPTSVIQFTGSLPTVDGPQVDDLAMFNIADETAVELICLGVRRQHDMVAEVSFVDHAPEIYDADQGAIPPFDSHINGRLFPMFLNAPVIETARGELYADDFISGKLHQRIIVTGSLRPEHAAVSNRTVVIRGRLKDGFGPWTEFPVIGSVISVDVPTEGIYEIQAKQKGFLQGLMGYSGPVESLWTPIVEVSVQSIVSIGLPAPSSVVGWYELDAQGTVIRIKLRVNVDITNTIPEMVALMMSVQSEPREIGVSDQNSYLRLTDSNILNSGTFPILSGSTSDNIIVTTASKPLPDINLSGFFWGSVDGIEYKKATGSTSTAFQFAEPFSDDIPSGTLQWVEIAWADERAPDFKLFNLVAANGSTEVAKWTAITQVGSEYRIAVERTQEATDTQVNAVLAQYYPAPGAGTETVMIPASVFHEVSQNTFEGSGDAQLIIPPGSWGAVTLATYVIDGMRIIRSPIIPITDWRQL